LAEFTKNAAKYDGLQTYCRKCHNPQAKQIEWLYGITQEEYDAMFAAQGGLCALCHKPPTHDYKYGRLVVDHDHACCPSKKCCKKCIRGLVHRKCNSLLGWAGDDIETLLQAAEYLRRSKAKAVGVGD
jgi:hypothetical protein